MCDRVPGALVKFDRLETAASPCKSKIGKRQIQIINSQIVKDVRVPAALIKFIILTDYPKWTKDKLS